MSDPYSTYVLVGTNLCVRPGEINYLNIYIIFSSSSYQRQSILTEVAMLSG